MSVSTIDRNRQPDIEFGLGVDVEDPAELVVIGISVSPDMEQQLAGLSAVKRSVVEDQVAEQVQSAVFTATGVKTQVFPRGVGSGSKSGIKVRDEPRGLMPRIDGGSYEPSENSVTGKEAVRLVGVLGTYEDGVQPMPAWLDGDTLVANAIDYLSTKAGRLETQVRKTSLQWRTFGLILNSPVSDDDAAMTVRDRADRAGAKVTSTLAKHQELVPRHLRKLEGVLTDSGVPDNLSFQLFTLIETYRRSTGIENQYPLLGDDATDPSLDALRDEITGQIETPESALSDIDREDWPFDTEIWPYLETSGAGAEVDALVFNSVTTRTADIGF